MAKTRKVLEAEADALFLSSEEIEGATTNADLTKLISENQPDEGYIFIELTQEMIDEDPDEYADYEVGDIVEVEIEEEEEEEEEEKPEEVQFEEGDLLKVKIVSRLKMDGETYEKGDTIKLRYASRLDSLIADGTLEVI